MCEYCEKARSLDAVRRTGGIDLCVAGAVLNLTVEYSIFDEGEIREIEYDVNYCPMCGRDLRGGDAS